MKTTSTPSLSLSDSRASETRGLARITLGEKRDFGWACVSLACVASISNRVIARKLERKQKKVEGGGGGEKRFLHSLPPPPSFIFFLLLSQFSR